MVTDTSSSSSSSPGFALGIASRPEVIDIDEQISSQFSVVLSDFHDPRFSVIEESHPGQIEYNFRPTINIGRVVPVSPDNLLCKSHGLDSLVG